MYFMDFAKSATIDHSCRYFLSGDNDFLKNYAIDKIATQTGREIKRVQSVQDIEPLGLFKGGVPICVIGPKSNPKNFRDFTIKISSSKMGKTYADNGFIEVSCSTLFPNQVSQFASLMLKANGLPVSYAKTIAESSRLDPYSVYNTVKAISVLDKKDLSQAKLTEFCRNLSVPDVFKTIDYFMEGNYLEFLVAISESRSNIHETLWALLGAVSKLQLAYINASSATTWYQKKVLETAQRLAPFGFERLLVYINDMCVSYGESRELLLLRLQKLIFYLRGLSSKL